MKFIVKWCKSAQRWLDFEGNSRNFDSMRLCNWERLLIGCVSMELSKRLISLKELLRLFM